MSLDGRTDVHLFARGGITEAIHRSDILEPIFRSSAGSNGDGLILMQYNARAHTAHVYI